MSNHSPHDPMRDTELPEAHSESEPARKPETEPKQPTDAQTKESNKRQEENKQFERAKIKAHAEWLRRSLSLNPKLNRNPWVRRPATDKDSDQFQATLSSGGHQKLEEGIYTQEGTKVDLLVKVKKDANPESQIITVTPLGAKNEKFKDKYDAAMAFLKANGSQTVTLSWERNREGGTYVSEKHVREAIALAGKHGLRIEFSQEDLYSLAALLKAEGKNMEAILQMQQEVNAKSMANKLAVSAQSINAGEPAKFDASKHLTAMEKEPGKQKEAFAAQVYGKSETVLEKMKALTDKLTELSARREKASAAVAALERAITAAESTITAAENSEELTDRLSGVAMVEEVALDGEHSFTNRSAALRRELDDIGAQEQFIVTLAAGLVSKPGDEGLAKQALLAKLAEKVVGSDVEKTHKSEMDRVNAFDGKAGDLRARVEDVKSGTTNRFGP
ncbi:MAG: hypothetical protein A3E85_01160 [Gammaproteobacteria bacterium RIFCSPHIGHO2_12_FULL_45_12]|nr:MAG: hypothetical protein A3E85_01160 [Gammaproteobacteria bacterium RIFCSPHIGHO2_12_FULL_45_12]